MSQILNWGECTMRYAQSVAGKPTGRWTKLPTPKKDTTKVIPQAGDTKEALDEGDNIIDALYGYNKYDLEFDLFLKKGEEEAFEDNNGLVDGMFAFQIIPLDPTTKGVQIDAVKLRLLDPYDTANGTLLQYRGKCLKPASGNTVKRIVIDPEVVDIV